MFSPVNMKNLHLLVFFWSFLFNLTIADLTIIFPGGSDSKNSPAKETRVQSLSQEDLLEEEMATRSSTFAWRIPRTEEPGGLQSVGSQRVGHD